MFAAAVEMNQPTAKLERAMRQLLPQVSGYRFIYISSDAVFSGERGLYTEAAQPDPINGYGRNLVLCEQLVQAMVADYCIVRPSYIFGFVNGQLDARLSRTRDTLLAGDESRAFENYYKSPLSVHEVAEAVVRLTQSEFIGPLHVAGPRMNAYDFHRQAMDALAVDTSNLIPEPMPTDTNLMPDTSLDSSRWWAMRGSQPMSIRDALQIEQFCEA
ncbi:MAG: sugar nucleotide-binding protein [Caldilineaceae bacterium]|nr:sugar nucleotide-binding protein [Caldilineaceae bacterium]